jgi:hypothetical protein
MASPLIAAPPHRTGDTIAGYLTRSQLYHFREAIQRWL